MASLSRSSKYRATPQAPLDEGERNTLVERLNAAYEAGDVGSDDYHRLLDVTFGATTLGEVAEVVEALPGAATHDVPAIVGSEPGRPGELTQPRAPGMGVALVVGGVAVVALILVVVMMLGLLVL